MIGVLFWLSLVSIAYIYLGYPIILWILARLLNKRPVTKPITPSVTLLIPCYKEEEVIAKKLENSLGLEYPSNMLQILVVVDGEEDRTKEIVERYADRGVELSFSRERLGKMSAINRAMKEAHGEIVVISDANSLFVPDALKLLVMPFADPDVGAVSGAKRVSSEDGSLGASEGLYWKYESFIKEQETRMGSCTGVSGEIFAFRRDLYTMMPVKVINDDFFMAMNIIKKGYRVVYVPRAYAYERVSPTAKDEIARRIRIIAGRYQAIAMGLTLLPLKRPLLVWQIISHKFLRPLVPFAMLIALFMNLAAVIWQSTNTHFPLLYLAYPYQWIFLTLQVFFYGLAWMGNHTQIKGIAGKILYIPTFLVNSNLAAVVGLIWFLTGRQSNLWQRVARREVL